MNFAQLVDELSELLGMELSIDKNRAVRFVLDRTIKMQLEFHSFKEAFCLIIPLEQLHQGMRREEVLKAALKSNHTFRPKGGHFGYVEKKGYLVLFSYIPLSIATTKIVFDEMVLLSQQARTWLEAFSSGQSAPQGAFEEKNLPRTSLFNAFEKK
ncbi:MAG: CesT family type III secretion system chaperone [Chlamydiia bacterium]